MGRTPDESEPRSVNILVRVLPEERGRWHDAAKRAGKTFSAWIRDLANAAAPAPKPKGKR